VNEENGSSGRSVEFGEIGNGHNRGMGVNLRVGNHNNSYRLIAKNPRDLSEILASLNQIIFPNFGFAERMEGRSK
jgi:hypothetical protein